MGREQVVCPINMPGKSRTSPEKQNLDDSLQVSYEADVPDLTYYKNRGTPSRRLNLLKGALALADRIQNG